jgi:hypothetical protein
MDARIIGVCAGLIATSFVACGGGGGTGDGSDSESVRTTFASVCGDGLVGEGEICDLGVGNVESCRDCRGSTDCCATDCRPLSACGDGFRGPAAAPSPEAVVEPSPEEPASSVISAPESEAASFEDERVRTQNCSKRPCEESR